MKAITLIQPWATLLVSGHKTVETRAWATNHRGPLLIHAGVSKNRVIDFLFTQEPFASCLKELGYQCSKDLPRGKIVGIVTVESVAKAEDISKNLSEKEKAFGDFRQGVFSWICKNPIIFKNPIPLRGELRIFEVESYRLKNTEAEPYAQE